MSLIKKPGIEEFRDSATVRAVRGARAVATTGGGTALRTVRKAWLAMILLAFIASGVGALFEVDGILEALVVLAMIGGGVALLRWLLKAPARPDPADLDNARSPDARVSVPLPEHLLAHAADEDLRIDYWPRALRDRAGLFILGGLVLAWLTSGITMAIGVCLMGQGILLAMPLFGDRTCVRGDGERLTVQSLLGTRSLAWESITAVRLHRLALRDVRAWFDAGSLTVLLVQGEERYETVELPIPCPLLGLDTAGAKALAARLDTLRAAAGSAMPVRLAPVEPSKRVINPHASATPEPFDPDRIMQRHLAERAAVTQAANLPPVPRPSFGRKGVS